MKYDVTLADETVRIDVSRHPDGGWWVAVGDGPRRHIQGGAIGAAEFQIREGDRVRTLGLKRTDRGVAMQLAGHGVLADVVDPRRAALSLAGGRDAGSVSTQMPGVIVRLLVEEGQTVAEGDAVIVVEAMKMENELRASSAGVVQAIHVAPGQPVEAGELLVSIGEET
ncbi:MAG: biotin/lipoyl-binding protein [Proteobacteria bacterium]|nr:biotin/lipoyl-binding protein [Pseudomonadota bacterium]